MVQFFFFFFHHSRRLGLFAFYLSFLFSFFFFFPFVSFFFFAPCSSLRTFRCSPCCSSVLLVVFPCRFIIFFSDAFLSSGAAVRQADGVLDAVYDVAAEYRCPPRALFSSTLS